MTKVSSSSESVSKFGVGMWIVQEGILLRTKSCFFKPSGQLVFSEVRWSTGWRKGVKVYFLQDGKRFPWRNATDYIQRQEKELCNYSSSSSSLPRHCSRNTDNASFLYLDISALISNLSFMIRGARLLCFIVRLNQLIWIHFVQIFELSISMRAGENKPIKTFLPDINPKKNKGLIIETLFVWLSETWHMVSPQLCISSISHMLTFSTDRLHRIIFSDIYHISDCDCFPAFSHHEYIDLWQQSIVHETCWDDWAC